MKSKGFTLIELLVVIAIIGVLSSVVLASLNTARKKGRDAALRTSAAQMRNLLEIEFNDKGSFNALKTGGVYLNDTTTGTNGCNNPAYFSGSNYASKAREICSDIVTKSETSVSYGNARLFIGDPTTDARKYSIMVYLPGKDRFLCLGSNGRTSDTALGNGDWSAAGCYGDSTPL